MLLRRKNCKISNIRLFHSNSCTSLLFFEHSTRIPNYTINIARASLWLSVDDKGLPAQASLEATKGF